MNIYFQSKNVDLHPQAKEAMANRIDGLKKFFSWDANVYIDIEQTHSGNHGPELFYTSIKIDDPKAHYFAEEYKETIKSSFDHAYKDIYKIIRRDRGRSGNIAKKAAQKIKRLFKREQRY